MQRIHTHIARQLGTRSWATTSIASPGRKMRWYSTLGHKKEPSSEATTSTGTHSTEWSGVSPDRFVEPNLDQVVYEIEAENFEAFVIEQSKKNPVLLSCYAEWCVPCQRLGKVLRKMASDSEGSFRLATSDIDKNEDLAVELNVTSVPTVILYKDGVRVDEFMGGRNREAVEEFLSQHKVPFTTEKKE